MAIFRLHDKKRFSGRSQCLHCGKKIQWYDNIPLISFFILGGKCRHCKKPISWQYPLVELATGILFVLAYIQSPSPLVGQGLHNISPSPLWGKSINIIPPLPLWGEGWGEGALHLLRNLIFISFLIVIFVYDLRWYYILDSVTIPALIIAFLFNIFLGFGFINMILGVIIGAGFFLAQYIISSGKWIGGGDIRLGAVMGVMLGWKLVILALFLAYTIGAVVSLGLIAMKVKKFSSKIPFGTFLSLATVISLLFGEKIVEVYMSMLS